MRTGIAALIYLACMALPLLRLADGLGFYMALAAVRPQQITYGIDLAGGRFSIVSIGFVLIGWAIRIPQMKPRWGPLHGLLLLFLGQLIVCRVTAMDAAGARFVFGMMYVPVVVALVAPQVLRREVDTYRCLWWFVGGLGFLGYWAAYTAHLTNNYYLYFDGTGEIMGPGGHIVDRNDLGLALNMALPILFYLFIMAKRKWARAIAFVSMLPAAMIVLETGSRGAFLGMAAVGTYILYKMHHKRWIFGLAILAMIGGLAVVPSEYIERIAGLPQATETDSSAAGRVEAWADAIEMARERPLTGVGLGSFTVWRAAQGHEALVAHNGFFQLLGTTGVPGALLWLLLVGRMWQLASIDEKRLRKAQMKGTRLYYMVLALKTSLIGYFVCTMFLSQEDFEFFYFELGMMGALHLQVGETIKRREEEKAAEVDAPAAPVDGPDPALAPAPGPGPSAARPWSPGRQG